MARLGAVAHSSALISATVRPRAASRNAPPDPGVYRYNVVIQVEDTVYNTQLETSDPSDAEFLPGCEVQSPVSKNILYLKRTSGDVVEASIVGKKKAKANWLKACYETGASGWTNVSRRTKWLWLEFL